MKAKRATIGTITPYDLLSFDMFMTLSAGSNRKRAAIHDTFVSIVRSLRETASFCFSDDGLRHCTPGAAAMS
jgi:hypothetical protein